MATTGEPFGLFWDSENGDRTYSAASFEYWLKKFFTSGVFNGDLQVLASSGMTLEIQPGYANADGKVKFWNGAFNLTLNAANSTYPRIDTIVITRDNVNRQIVCEVVTGSYSGDVPQPTAPVRNSEIYQLVLAQIYVGAGVTGITQSNITDTRPNNELCGYITGTVEELDFSAFTAQFEAYFAEFKSNKETDYASWFNAVQQQQIQDKAAWDAWYAALQEELHNLPEDSAEYLQIQIDELKESGLSGSIFKITTINASLEGKTVTISNADNTEVRSATFDENLECMIYGFKSVGQITITSTDGIQTATSVVTIPYFGNYTFPIAFWAATVNIQGDDNLKGATITVKDSNDATVATIVLNVITGQGVFNAQKADTYTFNYTVSGTSYSESLAVTEETTYSLSLSAGFDWKGWVDTASQLNSSDYASLSEVLADEEAVRELFLEHACVDYMAEATSSNADLETIIENDLCAKWINNSDYALDYLGANVVIKALMDTADKYGYGEWVITDDSTTPPTWGPKGNVPVMTANTAPYGEAFASSVYDNRYPWWAFNGITKSTLQDSWHANAVPAYIGYKFTNPIKVTKVHWDVPYDSTYPNIPKAYSIQGSNTGNTNDWETLGTFTTTSEQDTSHDLEIENDSYYLYYRMYITETWRSSGDYVGVGSLQFYGRELKVSVPTMTSNTAPFGEAFASSENTGAYNAFTDASGSLWTTDTSGRAGSYIGYEFLNPTIILQAIVTNRSDTATTQSIKECKLQYYDGNDWQDASNIVTLPQGGSGVVNANSTHNIKRWRLLGISNYGDSRMALSRLQFYGLDYSEKEFEVGTTKKWLYDHGLFLDSEVMSTANGWTAYNGTTVTTFTSPTVDDSEVYMDSDTICGIGCKQSINISDYSYLFAKVAGKTISSGSYGQLGVYSAKDNSNSTRLGYITMTEAKPSQIGLDISAQNTNAYCEFFVANGRAAWLNEFWLE